MIPIASGVRVWIATGHTDMRRSMNSLALLVQEAFRRDPRCGDLYVFRGKNGPTALNTSGRKTCERSRMRGSRRCMPASA
jgi:transposase